MAKVRACVLVVLVCGMAAVAAAPAAAQERGCRREVAFALVQVTTDGCLTEVAPGRWETGDAVRLNHLPVPVAPATRLVLTEPTADAPGGRLSVRTDIAVAGLAVHEGLLEVELPAGGPGDEAILTSFTPDDGQRLFGLKVGGNAALRLGLDGAGRHYALFRVVLDLPEIFRSGPTPDAGGLTATVGVRVDQRGVRADAVKAQVGHAYVGQIGIKDLCLSYTAAGTTTTTPCEPPAFGAQPLVSCSQGTDVARWDGSAVIVLPTESATEVGVFAGLRGGAFSYAGAQVANLGNAVPLATGVFLDRVGLAVCVDPPPFRFKGSAAIRFGPQFGATQAAVLDGEVEFVDTRPWVVDARGGLSLFGRRMADGRLTYRSSGAVDLGFDAVLDLGVASVDARVAGWLETRSPARFTVDGTGRVCVAGLTCATGEVTVSSVGLAGCLAVADVTYHVLVKDANWVWYKPWRTHWEPRTLRVRGGVGYHWQPSRVDVLGSSCDIGPYRATRTIPVAAARGAGPPDGARTLTLPAEPAVSLRIEGDTAPPKVVVEGPGGRRIASGAGPGVLESGRHVVAEEPSERVTHVLVTAARAGRWTVRAQPGSARIVSVQRAETREPPSVVGAVSGRGATRVLGYAHAAEDRSVTFVERGPESETKVLGRAAGRPCPGQGDGPRDRDRPRCGQLRFTPADGAPGVRTVYAVVGEQGVGFDERRVATYRVRGDERPDRPEALRLRRRGTTIEVTWRSAARRHDVRAVLGDGRRILRTVRGGADRAVIPGVGRRTTARVAVTAYDEALRAGPSARRTLRAER